ncbi:hypothetical protein SAMN05192583_3484 [Sphingomonas gellani]|uniref:Regulation of enolase protein 1, concanavalin A-like superfamily n=1 Tax=Sphingomonas gellani TaxID=1166340 RepID=A0A1H8J5P9_9SPHN|nr:DUF1349 domain-containing protein [Sphingomonas gellani]SEN75785.1 hypothetical protein SAMN05192583_3484 [Sphingomonas gellani]
MTEKLESEAVADMPFGMTRRTVVGGAVAGAVLARPAVAASASAWDAGTWLNRPRQAIAAGDLLDVVTNKGTDFWRETFYGFTRDSGHFLGLATGPRFTAQLRIRGDYQQLYDQAGIMVRIDATRWVKAGVELSDGRAMLSSVLTDGRSDWATAPYQGNPRDFWMRATVDKGVLRLQVSADGRTWPLVRLCPFPVADRYLVGPMTCTPEREGLKVRFSDWQLTPPLNKPLHDLS